MQDNKVSGKGSSTNNRYLFQECLDQVNKSLQQMNSSYNVQGGIFLDLLEMQEKKPKKNQASNLVYEVLVNSFKEQEKKSKDKNQELLIEWETFEKFNAKQVLGLILMKEKSLQLLKLLCDSWI